MDKIQEKTLLAATLKALNTQGVEARLLEPGRARDRHDGKIELGTPGKTPRPYLVEVKRQATQATVGAIAEQMKATGAKLLITEYIGPELADRLKAQDIQFADTAGNAFLHGPGMLVWVKGNRPVRMPEHDLRMALRKRTVARAFEPAGVKILFALLCKPTLVNEPYRTIADMAGVAHGTVGWVMGELPHRGYVLDFGPEAGGRTLKQIDQLLREWADAYARKLRPNLLLGRYTARDADWWKTYDPVIHGTLLGGEPAAAKITKHLRPDIITVYADEATPRMLASLGLRPDPEGKVEIAKRFWHFETETTKKGIVPLPLIYADLLATGDPRNIETAGLIRERYLGTRPER
jgi:hypothetical protein